MTEKQRRFADEYLIDCNATRAYKAAYPSVKKDNTAKSAGNRLLTNVDVKAYIDTQLEEMSGAKTADAKEVMEYLTAVMRGEKTDEVLKLVDGVQTKERLQVATKERLKAAELIGKRYGMFTEKTQIDGNVPVVIVDDIGGGEDD